VFKHIAGNRASNQSDVVKGEIVRNQAAPTVGTEFDLGHGVEFRRSLFVVRRSRIAKASRLVSG
jgi:hypothetical protein